MSARARWISVVVAILVVLGIVGLYLFNNNLTMSTDNGGPETWVVRPGETLTLGPEEVQPDNVYRCSDDDEGVNLDVASDGSARLYCGGPPGF